MKIFIIAFASKYILAFKTYIKRICILQQSKRLQNITILISLENILVNN